MKRNNMVNLILSTALNRSIKSIFILAIILFIRKMLNIKSIRWANIILWMVFFVYLLFPCSILITVTDTGKCEWLQDLLQSMSVISGHIKEIEKEAGYILSPINQMFVTGLVFIYVAAQIIKRNRTMRDSVIMERGSKADEYLSLFNLRRKVDIFINDKIASPVTYGIIHPKIVLQSYIFEDDELLKYVLIHELTHIKKFDIAFSHLKNLIMCINWYNPFILGAAKYIEDDIEILCDKLVIKRAGDTREHRKEYCMAMLKLTERNENSRFVLKLHPTKERIIVMKKWRRTVLGIVAFAVAVGASMTSFVEVRAIETNQVVANVESSYTPINKDNRVEEIIEKEYIELVENQEEIVPYIADINGKETLEELSHKKYKFDMSSWTSANHDGFTVKMSNMSSKGSIDYEIIIKENGNLIYKNRFEKEATLNVKAQDGSSYEVIIDNNSVNTLKYNIKIKSYIR